MEKSNKIKLKFEGVIVDYLNHKSAYTQMKLKIPGNQVSRSANMIRFIDGKEFNIKSRRIEYGDWVLHYVKINEDGSADIVCRTFAEGIGEFTFSDLEKDQEEAVDMILKEIK